jgi:bacteriocin biosynthesis cyclodehydratase domain-containing protein
MEAVRLRPLVEVVEDGDGALYLLRGPAGGDCVIRTPPAAALPLVRALERGGTAAQLSALLRADGHAVDDAMVATMLEELAAVGVLERLPDSPDDERLGRQLLYLRDRAPSGADAGAMQRRVAAAHVAVLGCGGLGSWAATGLACIGVGSVALIDDDVVELSNLNRQLLFKESDLGRPKVEAAAEALRSFNSALAVEPVRMRLASPADVVAAIDGASFVLACADRPPYLIARWINRACLDAGVPHVSAGQLPPTVRVGPLVLPGRTACLGCLELALREDNPLYDRLERLRAGDARPMATLGPASGIVGSVIATEVLHHLTGLAPPATRDAVWTMDLRTLAGERTAVVRRPDCPECGAPPRAAITTRARSRPRRAPRPQAAPRDRRSGARARPPSRP